MKNILLLLAAGALVGVAIADKKQNASNPDPIDIIIEKSNNTMRKASRISAKADEVVVSRVMEMKQTIEVLEEEKEQLVEQVKVMEDEIITIKSASVQPFDVLAIGGVPDTASRK